jgi:hypothetical protein
MATELQSAGTEQQAHAGRIGYRPLWPVNAVMAALDVKADGVLALLAERKLEWGFHVESPNARRRREIRIWRGSVLKYAGHQVSGPTTEETVFDDLIGRPRRILTSREVQRILFCSQAHLYTLLGVGDLECVRRGSKGPGHSALITTGSLKAFLQRRRL